MRNPLTWWFSIGIRLVVTYVLTAAGVTFAAWEYGMWQTHNALIQNPGFAQRLETYSNSAYEWQQITSWIQPAIPIIETIEAAKASGIWGELIRIGGSTGKAIELLDPLILSVIELDNRLIELTRLGPSANVVTQHLNAPTRDSQQFLYESFEPNTEFVAEVIKYLITSEDLVASAEDVVDAAASSLSSLKKNDLLALAVDPLYERTISLQNQTTGLEDSVTRIRANLERDWITIRAIVDSTEQARRIESAVAPSILRPLVNYAAENLVSILLVCSTYIILTSFGSSILNIVISGSSHPKTIRETGKSSSKQTGSNEHNLRGRVSFDEIGIPNSFDLDRRSQIGLYVHKLIEANNYTQKEIRQMLNIDPSQISYLLNGHYTQFTTDELLDFLQHLHQKVTIHISPS